MPNIPRRVACNIQEGTIRQSAMEPATTQVISVTTKPTITSMVSAAITRLSMGRW
jgi:hypothetical protein